MPINAATVYGVAVVGVVLIMAYYVVRVMTARTPDERHRLLDEEEAVSTAAGTVVPLM